jgi:hypothetical protein
MTTDIYRCGSPYLRGILVALLVVMAISQWFPGRSLLIAVPLTALAVFNFWFWLLRLAYELRLHGEILDVETPLGTRSVDVARLVALRSTRVDPSVCAIEVSGESSILFLAGRPVEQLVERLQAVSADLVVTVTSGRLHARTRTSFTSVDEGDPTEPRR